MNYVVMELQTTDGVTVIVPPTSHSDRNEAEQKYHQVLSFAAVSSVPVHTAIMVTEDGRLVKCESYDHPAPEPEEVEEPEELAEPEGE